MLVEVWSDIVCPWCLAGRRRFEEAVEQMGAADVDLVHRAFELPHKPGRPHPRTFDAHRLLAWALERHGPVVQGRLDARLMEAWSTDRADVADHQVLCRLVVDAGLDGAEAAAVLADGDAYAEAVRRVQAEAVERDIYAVPTFVVDGAVAIPGAQDVDTFVSLLSRIRARRR